jgi:hypothetical protein
VGYLSAESGGFNMRWERRTLSRGNAKTVTLVTVTIWGEPLSSKLKQGLNLANFLLNQVSRLLDCDSA